MSKILDSYMNKTIERFDFNKIKAKDKLVYFGLDYNNGQRIYFIDNIKYFEKEVLQDSKNIFGKTTKKEWTKFVSEYRDEFLEKYESIKKYVSNKKYQVYLHSSPPGYINMIKKMVKNKNFYLDNQPTSFNPPGLWFSCGTAWFDFIYEKGIQENDYSFLYDKPETIYFISLYWSPFNMYEIFLDDLKIADLDNCNKLKKFTKKYKDNSKDRKQKLSLDKIEKDNYNGIKICPYLTIKCIDYFRNNIDKEKDFSSLSLIRGGYDYYNILRIIFLDLINKEEKDILWSMKWETATGVIFNNIDKIKYKKIK